MKSINDYIYEAKMNLSGKFHTEWFDEAEERGGFGICCDTLEEAKKWCKETCKKENNKIRTYLVRDHKYSWFDDAKKAVPYVCCLDKDSLYHDYENIEEIK